MMSWRNPSRLGLDAGALRHLLDLTALRRQNQGDDGAGLAGAGRAASAVKIVLVVRRWVDMNH